MAARKKTSASSKKKSVTKQVIEHDPFSMSAEEDESSEQIEVEKADNPPKEQSSEEVVISSEPVDESGGIDLGSSLIISEVELCRTTLLDALQGGGDLVLNGGAIEQIDGAGLQLLAAFAKETEKIGVTYKWSSASQALCEAASQLGLSELLQLNEASKAA